MSSMSPTRVVASSALHVGVKGRVVLPAAVRRAAHLEEGAEVVARADGEGRVVIETVASVRERIWNAAPQPTGADTVADVRELRDADELLCAANMARQARELGSEQDSAAAGAALLAHLGL
jgi:AbrB family looped-hinge helix DNA binding protein